MANAVLQELDTGLYLFQFKVLIRLVRAVDRAGAHDNSFHTQLLQKRCLRSEGNRLGSMAGEFFCGAHEFAISSRLEWCDRLDE